jgi:glyoxylase-like metal-dependent hydrolase (beta-lactamase superfamily II)
MGPAQIRIGSTTVYALTDGAGSFFEPRDQAFATATAAHWALADALDPAAVTPSGEWRLQFRCFAIRFDDGRVILVDTGIGPADAPAKAWAPVPGRLPDELTAAGIAPDDVTKVVLTHLHSDHIGWAAPGGIPLFRQAEYLLQQAELDALDQINPALRERIIEPLRSHDQLRLLSGDTSLPGPVRVVATPGHTPGHQSVLVTSADRTLAVTGDLLVHAVQLVAPELPYSHEMDPGAARESRIALLTELAAPGAVLATPHLTDPFLQSW